MPDIFGTIDQIAERQPAAQPATRRRRRNPRIRETQPEAERTDREDVREAVGESLAQAVPQIESAFDTIDRPDPIDSDEDGWQMMSADDAFGEPAAEDAWRNEAGGQPFQLRAPEMRVGPGNNLGAYTMRPDLELEHPGGFRHNDRFIDDETYGPYGDDAPQAQTAGVPIDDESDPMRPVEDYDPVNNRLELRAPTMEVGPGNNLGNYTMSPDLELEHVAGGRHNDSFSDDEIYGEYEGAPDEMRRAASLPTVAEEPIDPDWEMMDSEEALGPDSPYTPEELEAMQAGERRDRIMGGVQGGLQALGGLLGAIGGGVGNMGLASAGGGMAQGASDLPASNAYETAKTAADERLARDMANQQRDEEMAMRERTLSINERNAASGAENATANRQMRELAERRNQQEFDAQYNPDSQSARNARERLASMVRSADPNVIGDWSDVVESSAGLGAVDIQRNIDDLQETLRGNRAPRRGGGGGGGGRGLRLDDVGGPDAYEQLIQMRARQTGASPEMVRALYPADDRRSLERLRNEAFGEGARDISGQQRIEAHQAQVEAQGAMPGYVRVEGAPQLTPAQADAARELATTFENLSVNAQRMERLARRITAAQAAGGAGSVRITTEDIATANQLQERISAALRILSNYGVPNGDELQRIERLAPTLVSIDGWVNAERMYRAMRNVLRDNTRRELRGRYGYAPAPQGGQR